MVATEVSRPDGTEEDAFQREDWIKTAPWLLARAWSLSSKRTSASESKRPQLRDGQHGSEDLIGKDA